MAHDRVLQCFPSQTLIPFVLHRIGFTRELVDICMCKITILYVITIGCGFSAVVAPPTPPFGNPDLSVDLSLLVGAAPNYVL